MGEDRDKPAVDDTAQAAGRAAVDGRNRNVWQWDGEQIDDTSVLLRRLQNDELAIEPTQRVPVQADHARGGRSGAPNSDDRDSAEATDSGGESGFDPYNSSS